MSGSTQTLPAPPPESPNGTPARGHRPTLYFTVWRWHFYAGLLVVPFVLILALTGGLYTFRHELDAALRGEWLFTTPAHQSLTADELLRRAEATFPGSAATYFAPAPEPGRSAEVRVAAPQARPRRVFLDPHSGAVLGTAYLGEGFTEVVRALHGNLLLGRTGQLFVELIGCWALVLVLTGLYLWWPRPFTTAWGVLLPRWRPGGRTRLRDLHAVPAVYLSGLVLFLVLSGLPWAVVGAKQVEWLQAAVGETEPPDLRWYWPPPSAAPQAATAAPDHSADHAPKDWLEKQPLVTNRPLRSQPTAGAQRLPLEQVLATAAARSLTPCEVRLPPTPDGVFLVSEYPDNPMEKHLLYIEQYTGEVLADYRWEDFGPVSRAVTVGIALHQGDYFGLPNQLLCAFTCLGLIVSSIFGVAMWWKRRPKGRLGVPKTPGDRRLGGVVALVVLCAVAMPLVGASLLVLYLVDRLLVARSPRLQTLLS